MLEIH